MCAVAAIPIIGMATQVLGGIMDFAGQRKQARATEQAGKARQAIAYQNAMALRDQAAAHEAAGAAEARKQKMEGRARIAQMQAESGSSGGDVGSGSFVNLVLTEQAVTRSNAAQTLQNAANEARVTRQRANITQYEGDVDMFTARQEGKAMRAGAVKGLLDTGSKVAGKWAAWKKSS